MSMYLARFGGVASATAKRTFSTTNPSLNQLNCSLRHLSLKPSNLASTLPILSLASRSFATDAAQVAATTVTTTTTTATKPEVATKKPISKKPAAKKTAAASSTTKKTMTTKKPVTKRRKTAAKGTKKSTTKKKKKKSTAATAKKIGVKRKPRTDEQKEAKKLADFKEMVKELKVTALTTPKKKSVAPHTVYLQQSYSTGSALSATEQMRDIMVSYKNLGPVQRQELSNIAAQNSVDNKVEYDAWIQSHTPEQIHQANLARTKLRRFAKATPPRVDIRPKYLVRLSDPRQVKRPVGPLAQYLHARYDAGAYKDKSPTEFLKLASEEFKALSTPERQKIQDTYQADKERYAREYQSTYGYALAVKAPASPKAKAKAA